jgi:integrase
MATITKTTSGTWQVKVRIKGAKSVTKTFKRKGDATRWIANIEHEIRNGIMNPPMRGDKMLFSELLDKFIADDDGFTSFTPAGQRSASSDLNLWRKELGHLTLKSITADLLEEKIDELRGRISAKTGRPIKPNTLRRSINTLASIFKFAKSKKLIGQSPTREIEKPSANDERVRFLSTDEREALLAAVDASTTPALPVLFRVAIFTGMRRGELLGLTWDRLNLTEAPITYQSDMTTFAIPPRHALLAITKNGQPRMVPLPQPAWQALVKWGRVRHIDRTTLVFRSRGNPHKPFHFRRAWEKALTVSGVENFHWHDLRHTFASEMVMAGTDLLRLSELTGHKSLDMLKRYSHLSPDHALDLVETMAKRVVKK